MAQDSELADEIAALRAEIEALKTDRRSHASAEDDERFGVGEILSSHAIAQATGLPSEQLQEFQSAIQDLSEAIETEIAARPVVSVGAAFMLGILIGRLSGR